MKLLALYLLTSELLIVLIYWSGDGEGNPEISGSHVPQTP